jgi:hypothetical protein
MRKNGGSNSAGMFDQYRDACATKDGHWLEADYERTVSVMLCFAANLFGQNQSR